MGSELRQTAVRLQYDALLQRFRLEGIQSQQQFVRAGGVHVFPGIRESNPHAVHVAPAGQLHPDGVISGHRLEKLGNLRPRHRERDSPQVVTLAEDSLILIPVGRTYLFCVEEGSRP